MTPPTIRTLRLELQPQGPPPVVAGAKEVLAWQCRSPGAMIHGTLFMARLADRWEGPSVLGGQWEGSGLSAGERASLLKEAALVVLEAALDASGWSLPVLLPSAPPSTTQLAYVDPQKVGFHPSLDGRYPGQWVFDPKTDGYGSTEHAGVEGVVAALSGGGLRATGFCLGAFSVLDELGAVQRLQCVTAVSGGSIFAGAWLAARARAGSSQALDYKAFQAELKDFIQEKDGVPASAQTKAPSLVRRYADYCAHRLLANTDGQPLRLESVPRSPEVVFQITELASGGSFVLVATERPRTRQGAGNQLILPGGVASHVRLADAVCASAAFPVGFEPFVFPRDFDLSVPDRTLAEVGLQEAIAAGRMPEGAYGGLPLVDGGVFDNQGIHAALNALRRHDTAELLLVVDVDQSDATRSLLEAVPLRTPLGLLLGLLLGLVVATAAIVFCPRLVLALLLLALAATPLLAIGLGGRLLPETLRRFDFCWPPTFLQALRARAPVAVVLLAQVFMRRVRRLSYDEVFSRGPSEKVLPVILHIDDLLQARDARSGTLPHALRERYPVDPAILTQVQRATKVGTVLRLPGGPKARKETAEALFTAGRATAILKLLGSLHRVPRPRTPKARQWLRQLEQLHAAELRPGAKGEDKHDDP